MNVATRERPWSAREYADFRSISTDAAAQERYKGNGPKFIKANGRVYYDPADVYAWLDSRKVQRTDEQSGSAA